MKGLGVTTVNALRQSNKRLSHRYGDGYVGPSNRAIYEMYLAELRAAGKDPARARVMGGDMWLIVADDPDRTFATYAPHLLYWFNAYSKWFEGTDTSPWPHLDNAEELLSRGLVNVVTPDAAIKLIKDRIAEVPVEMYTMMLTPPGIALNAVQTSLELFAKKVMPHFK
jgi:hypothetical protein